MDKEQLMRKIAEKKEKSGQSQNQDPSKPEPKSQEVLRLEAEANAWQRRYEQLMQDREDAKLEKEAEKVKSETEALERESDLRRSVSEAVKPEKIGAKSVDDLEPSQVIEILSDATAAATDAHAKLMESKMNAELKTVNERLAETQIALVQIVKHMDKREAEGRFKDFGEYADDVQDIMKNTQGLSSTDAYLLAKAKASQGSPTQSQTETERPSQPPAAESSRDEYVARAQKQQGEFVSPKQAFQKEAAAAVDRVLARRTTQ